MNVTHAEPHVDGNMDAGGLAAFFLVGGEFMKYRTTLVVTTVVALVAAIAVTAALFGAQYVSAQKSQQAYDDYVSTNSHFADVGQVITLDSQEDSLGSDVGYVASFPWNGCVEASVQSAEYYDNPQEAGLDPSTLIAKGASDPSNKILVCKIWVKNVDADFSQDNDKNLLYAGMFDARIDADERTPPAMNLQLAYFDGTASSLDDVESRSHYLLTSLSAGEEKTLTMAYVVRPEYEGGNVFISVGKNAAIKKYVLDLPDPQ